MKKVLDSEFRDIHKPTDDYLAVTEKLKVIYNEMGQGDNLLEHSPSREVEYPWTLSHIVGDRILDAGCGASPMLLYLKRSGKTDLVGIDAQSSFENPTFSFKPEWERKYDITYQQANIISYRSKVFDTVYCVSVIEHIFRPIDRIKALINLWENVKDGGRLIVTLDYDIHILLGLYLILSKSAIIVDAFNWNEKVFGICLEKKFSEGMAEWFQINKGL